MFGFLKLHNFFLKLFRGIYILYVVCGYFTVNWLSSKKLLKFFVPRRFKYRGLVMAPQERLRVMLEKLGPTFVKFGQILADRPDIVSKKLRKELKKLQNNVKPFDHDHAISLIEMELSAPISSVFKHFDLECIGSASMAQVYKAQLYSGANVVVKIQRPHIKEKINLDLQILEYIANKISEEFPEFVSINLTGIVTEFGETLNKELNYFNEAANARRFGEMFKDSDICKIPKVYEEISTAKLLVMEYIEGISPNHVRDLVANNFDTRKVAENGVNVFLKMIFEHGFFHADPHAGNIFVLPGNKIGLIDFGMTGSLKPSHMEFLAKFVRALDQKNASTLADAILILNTSGKFKDREDLEFYLDEMLKKYKSVPYDKMKVSQVMDDCFRIIRKHGITIPGGIFLLIKCIATIEKVGLKLDPEISVANHIRPYATTLIKKEFSIPKIASTIIKSLKKYVQLSKSLPDDISDILYNIKTGKLTHDIKLDSEEMFTKSIKQAGKTIALAILISVLVIGSSFILSKGQSTFFVNTIFVISIFYAFIMIVRLFSKLKT